MPTVDDLRDALNSLERHAPDPAAVLPSTSPVRPPTGRRGGLIASAAVVTVLVVAAATVAAWIAAVGRTAHHSGTGTSQRPEGRRVLLPFRLTSTPDRLHAIDAYSAPTATSPFGALVVTEYGTEITIYAGAGPSGPIHGPSASKIDLGSHPAWIDTTCALRPAPSASATTSSSGTPTPRPLSSFDPGCSLEFSSRGWHVLVWVAGPGGGSRTITPQQFVRIARSLEFATTQDSSSWFPTTV